MTIADAFNLVDPETGEVLNHKGRRLDHIGREIPDPTPVPPPPGYKEVPSIFDVVRDVVRQERLARGEGDADPESFEEADDFEIGDEQDFISEYEGNFDVNLEQLRADVEARKRGQEGTPAPTTDIPASSSATQDGEGVESKSP